MARLDFHEALARARRGDEEARGQLVEKYYPVVQRMVHRELEARVRRGRPWLAGLFSTGDVVHDVLIGVLRDLHGFQGSDEKAFVCYLATNVTHQLLDAMRFHQAQRRDRRRVKATEDFDARVGRTMSPTSAASDKEEHTAVHAELAGLSERDRELLELRFQREAGYAEIAAELGYDSAEAVRRAVRSALSRLLVKLRARGIDKS